MQGVVSINRFFKESGAQDTLNSNMLLLHAGAFGLYLVTAVMICLVGVSALFVYNELWNVIYQWTIIAANIGSFVA